MKVVHINSFDGNGGAAKAAFRLHQALLENGIESTLAVNVLNEEKRDNIIELSGGWILKMYILSLRVLEVIALKLFVKPIKIPYSLPFLGRNISKYKLIKQADIIHLHWINQGFLTPKSISQLKKLKKPIVWTMHDSNAFTGGCHVRYDCTRFIEHCGNCPVLKKSTPNDLSNYFWIKKNKAYAGLPLSIITPSKWMYDNVKRSSLLKNKNVFHIPNTLNIEIFKPFNEEDRCIFRKELGWDQHNFVILSGFMPSKVSLHKGVKYFEESISGLLNICKDSKKKIKIVFFGVEPQLNPYPFPVSFLGRIDEESLLAKYYSAADVFLTTSIEDNFPNTVLESLSCGTPVVAFKTGGIPDMINHKENGFLADFKKSSDIIDGLLYIMNHKEREKIKKNARDSVTERFAPSKIVKEHLNLYDSLL